MSDRWLSVGGVAHILDVSREAVRVAIKRGDLAATQVFGAPETKPQWIVRESDLEEWKPVGPGRRSRETMAGLEEDRKKRRESHE